MNGMNEQRFLSLAMKVIGGQPTDAERTELDAALAADQELRAQFAKLRGEVAVARGILPLVEAANASAGQLPAYARERLQTKVRQTLGRPVEEKRTPMWDWRWFLVLAPAVATIVLLLWVAVPAGTVVQVAMLDTVGGTRGASEDDKVALQGTWPDLTPEVFSSAEQVDEWEKNWPPSGRAVVVKIIYDKGAGEVRVSGRKANRLFQRTFPVEAGLGSTLKQVESYVADETGR